MSADPYDDTPLSEARDWLRDRIDHGATCPCCTQFVKVYKRVLPNATACVMIALWHHDEGRRYIFLPDVLDTLATSVLRGTPHQGGYGTIGHYWGLLRQRSGERDDGSHRVGWWKLTDLGREFVVGDATVPKFAHLYNGRCLRLSGPPWSIKDALGAKFDYAALMAGSP